MADEKDRRVPDEALIIFNAPTGALV